MNEMEKRKLRKLFEVNSVGGGFYGDGFYDALEHVHRKFVHSYRPKNQQ